MKKDQRNSNIELLRIFAMLMIISSHMSLHGLINNGSIISGSTINKVIASFMVLGNVGVGIFFAITGYFTTNGKQKHIGNKLLADIIFFTTLNVFILLITSQFMDIKKLFEIESNTGLIKSVLHLLLTPITGENWWFITAYIYLILFIAPILDKIIEHMKVSGELYFIVIMLFFMVISDYLGTPAMRFIQASAYYLLGKYVKNFMEFELSQLSHIIIDVSIFGLLILHTIMIFVYYNTIVGILHLISNLLVTVLICPLMVFLIFIIFINKKLKYGIKRGYINTLAETTLGIYLLHDSVYVRKLLWNYLLPMDSIYSSKFFGFYAILTVFSVFLIGVSINLLYIKFIRPFLVCWIEVCKVSILHLFRTEE